jgi:hypothetical protein
VTNQTETATEELSPADQLGSHALDQVVGRGTPYIEFKVLRAPPAAEPPPSIIGVL